MKPGDKRCPGFCYRDQAGRISDGFPEKQNGEGRKKSSYDEILLIRSTPEKLSKTNDGRNFP